MLSISWWGESVSNEFWADHAYYFNLASAVMGAFCGIPIIVIAIGRFNEFSSSRRQAILVAVRVAEDLQSLNRHVFHFATELEAGKAPDPQQFRGQGDALVANAQNSLRRLAEASDAAWSFGARSHELVALWRVTDPAITEDLLRFLDKSIELNDRVLASQESADF